MNNRDLPDDFVATPEFEKGIELINSNNKPIFITGNAGTGKSTFLKYYLENCEDEPVILAPTGIAAINVGGSTIHSFFRFPPQYVSLESISRNYKWQLNFRNNLKTLIIDEISMVRADMIDNIDVFLRKNMENDVPFGGVKLIMIGDLHQLPPVVEKGLKDIFSNIYRSPFFFDAIAWNEVEFDVFELTHIFRQKDPTFITVLNNVRRGRLTASDANILNTRVGRTLHEKHIMLTTTNRQSETLNSAMLRNIRSEASTYDAVIEGDFSPKYFPTSERLVLKVGAQVMMIRNGSGYCNGTIGVISELGKKCVTVDVSKGDPEDVVSIEIDPISFERIEYTSSESKVIAKPVGTFTQLPLKLAWAITMHKSQGMTFDNVKIDFGFGSFAHGQTYVALSRCRSLEGISLVRRIQSRDIMFDKSVLEVTK